MSSALELRMGLLTQLPAREQVELVAAALPSADDSERQSLARTLIRLVRYSPTPGSRIPWIGDRQRKEALHCRREAVVCLAEQWHVLDAESQDEAADACRGMWRACIDDPQVVLRIAAATGDADLLACAIEAMDGRTPPERRLGESALRSIVAARRSSSSARILGALVSGCTGGELLRRRTVQEALLELASRRTLQAHWRDCPTDARWMIDPAHPVHEAIRSALRRGRTPQSRARAWELLAIREYSVASLDRLATAARPSEHEAVLARAHLVHHPDRRRAVRTITTRTIETTSGRRWATGTPIPTSSIWNELGLDARRGAARWVDAIRMSQDDRVRALEPASLDPDVAVRYSACRESGGEYGAHDPDHRVARTAELLTMRRSETRLSSWNDASPASRVAARRLLASDRSRFVAELRNRVRCGEGLGLIAHLGLAGELEVDLLRLLGTVANSDDESQVRLTATIARTLANSRSACRALRALLRHQDGRVRANALESLARTGDGAVIELKEDPHQRIRANALRSMLDTDDRGVVALGAMLHDDRDAHRVSALWVCERTSGRIIQSPNWKTVVGLLGDLASDDNTSIRRRAERCHRRFVFETQLRWRLPTGGPAKGAA